MGYEEVNLNLGCPAGTVTAKGKGSGFLRTPTELETFLERISCLYQHEILKPLAVIGKNRISDFILRSTTRLKFPSSEVS